ncbi:hypothetical protein Tdes44962_MAKER09371 [Teratosphaeria destructans]|uniref:Uncharacterized protein n=1 Tax=Teratosphaeria destructans TaxID=418781 RepID=A0A9W7STS3_9PEZI|nr:hypothetical protein Tdes44962_MAKER09371 [Teratosphaeria destructans]
MSPRSWQSHSSRSSSTDSLISIDKLKDSHIDRRSSNTILAEHQQTRPVNYNRHSSLLEASRINGAQKMMRRLFRRSQPTTTTPVGECVLQALKEQKSFWEAHTHCGTDYDIDEECLRKITDVDCRRKGANDIWYATTIGHLGYQKTLEHLAELQVLPRTATQEAARLRLRGAWDRPPSETNPDLFIKIVHDLDSLLFSGELDGRLLVTWEDKVTPFLHPGVPPDKQPHPHFRRYPDRWHDALRGWCNPASFRLLGLQKAHICLNKDLYLQCERRVMWGLIIFEMIMAYIHLGCGHFGNDGMAIGGEVGQVRERCVRLLGLEGVEDSDVVNGWLPVPEREDDEAVCSSAYRRR